jgi:hydrogenase expression/formation protein HypC
MCLALPGRIEWIGRGSTSSIPGTVSFGEQTREVDLVMVPEALVGDHVIVHSGYAIRIVGAKEVARILEIVDLP